MQTVPCCLLKEVLYPLGSKKWLQHISQRVEASQNLYRDEKTIVFYSKTKQK